MKTRHRHLQARGAVLAALVAVGGGPPLTAQPEPATCARNAAAAMAPGAALRALHIGPCPESRPQMLLTLWARSPLPTDEREINLLVKETGQTRDERVYAAVMAVATSPARPTADRLQALRVLYYYHVPPWMPLTEDLTRTTRPYYVSEGSSPHDTRYAVTRPFPPGRTAEYPGLLYRLSTDDPDPLIRLASARLRQTLVYRDPINTPIPPGAIRLVAPGCGGVVQIQSTADISLEVRLRVLGTTYDRVVPASGGYRLPPGVVVADLGGRELARLVDRGPPCPPR